jgi:hypothetical protein
MLFDLKIERVTYPLKGKNYLIDLGIFHLEMDQPEHLDYWNFGRIADLGDLSTYYGYETLDGSGLTLKPGAVYNEIVPDLEAVEGLDLMDLWEDGITYIMVENLPENQRTTNYPIILVSKEFDSTNAKWDVNDNPTFVLWNEERPVYIILNGFVIDLTRKNPGNAIKNGLIIR